MYYVDQGSKTIGMDRLRASERYFLVSYTWHSNFYPKISVPIALRNYPSLVLSLSISIVLEIHDVDLFRIRS